MRRNAMRAMDAALTLFILSVCCFGRVQSRSFPMYCPSGQFLLKNQCVLCHPTCAECLGHELFDCLTCGLDEDGKERFLYQGHCRLHCPRAFYPDRDEYTCVSCMPNCEICADANVCAKCREGYRLQSGICLTVQCGAGQVQDPDTKDCIDCGVGCKTCSTDDPELCISCTDGYFLSRQRCRQHCPQRTFEDAAHGVCVECVEPCVDCRSRELCLTCQNGHFLHNGSCVKECPAGTFTDARGWRCQPCHGSCLSCRGPGPRDCERCGGWTRPVYGKCPTLSCPDGQFVDADGRVCGSCDASCLTCFGPTAQNCISCASGFMLETEAECVERCPVGFYGNGSSGLCERCPGTCAACDGPERCVSCRRDTDTDTLFLFQGGCWAECPEGFFETDVGTCEACSDLCLTCDGSSTQCLSCPEGLHLSGGQCRQSCGPMSFAAEDGTCRRCAPHCDACTHTNMCTSE